MTTLKRPEVFRIAGICRDATIESLTAVLSAQFPNDEKDIKIEVTIVPSCDITDDTNAGIVCFIAGIRTAASMRTATTMPKFLNPLYEGDEDIQIETEIGVLSIDKHFHGPAQLYPTPSHKQISAE
jgi:hypothetical protein